LHDALPISWARRKEEAQTAKDLRLRPAMHRHVVPPDDELARPEGTIGLPPMRQQIVEGRGHSLVEQLRSTGEQTAQIQALSIVVQLPAIDGQSGSRSERLRQALLVE